MSQVWRRLSATISVPDGLSIRNHGVLSLLPQYKPRTRPVAIFREKKCHLFKISHYRKTVLWQNNRSMSILTDLLRRKKTKDDEEDEAIPEVKTMALFDDTPKSLTEEEIAAKRNISRLNPRDQRLVKGLHPYTEPMAWHHHTVLYKRKMFGRYGESSGVNPGLLWPTRQNLKDMINYENICHPLTIQQMVEIKQTERRKERDIIEARIKEVDQKMSMLGKVKQDLFDRQAAKDREANEAKARREKLMEDVRRHFGYSVDPREERFQEMLAKKEKEQKKSMKEARKLEKQKRILEKLEGKGKDSQDKSTSAKKADNVEGID